MNAENGSGQRFWAFCYAKKKKITPEIAEQHPDAGDVWIWTAIGADSTLAADSNRNMPSYARGRL